MEEMNKKEEESLEEGTKLEPKMSEQEKQAFCKHHEQFLMYYQNYQHYYPNQYPPQLNLAEDIAICHQLFCRWLNKLNELIEAEKK